MELVTVKGELREIGLENPGEVNAARLCLRARAIRVYQQPREDPLGEQTTTGRPAKPDREVSACNAAATALHDVAVSSFVVRGEDVPLLHRVLTEEIPAQPQGIVPKEMTEPTIIEMTEKEFAMYASHSPAHTASQGVLHSPQAS